MASVVKRPAPLPRWFWFASLLGCTPGFKKSRCKKLLRVTMSRIKLLRGRREVQVRQLRRDVAQLLQLDQEENAESRLDRLWKEQSLLSAYTKTGEYCQLVKSNLSNIAGQRECPMDLKESLASLCFAASCCADLPELQEIREIMVMKYGKDFLISSHKLLPGNHVNKMFLEAFATKEPSELSKKALLKGILTEYNIVQPKKPKLPPIDGGSKKAAPSDMPKTAVAYDVSRKQQSRHEHGSNFDICKQHSNFDARKQEVEKHHKSPKQTRPTACMPTLGTLDKQHTPFPCAEGDGEIKMLGRHNKVGKNIHGQVDKVEQVTNETEVGSHNVLLGALSHDRHGKERKSKQKALKRNAKALQAGEEDRHPPSNGRSFHEKSGLEGAANEVIFGYGKVPLPDEPKIRSDFETLGKTAKEKFRLERETNGIASGQRMHERGEESPTREFDRHTMHREKKMFYEECPAETKQKVIDGQPWNQRYREEAPQKDLNAYQMQEERNVDQEEHYHVERHAHGRSNGKSRSERVIQEFDKIERELPRRDYGDMKTESNGYHRSNGTERVINEFDNVQQKRSPHKRNHHHRSSEKSMLVRDAYEFGNQQPSLPGDRSLPEYGDTHKVQKERKHSSKKSLHENAKVEASRDHPSAHVSQKGRKKSVKKHHFDETQQDAWIDYRGSLVPDKTADVSPHLHKRADNNGDQLKDAAKQGDRNLHWMENHLLEAKTETRGDHKEARLNGSALELYMEDEHLPEDYDIHAMQKNRRRARKHNIDHADSKTEVLNGLSLDRKPRGEINAEEVVNGQIYWPGYNTGSLIHENDSTDVTQSEKAYFPQWHQQLDLNPKACKESGSGLTAAEVRNGSYGYGDRPQEKHFDQQEDAEEKLKSRETSPLPSRFTKPPQRPPPPVPPYRVSSLPNRQPLNNAPVLHQRCTTLETSHFRSIQEPHVHPKLPEYEDLVASFAALRNKPAKPPAYSSSS